ncbi:MAG: acylphosphatase [Proteobacteria bacterium]|nr:acylphosphatase [Pseudomonadota bacterium]
MIARRCFVAGRVQGVFYRASTRARAETLGVTGHAGNLPDGRVEILACGERDAVDALCTWLWQGSPASHVSAVEIEELTLESVQPWPQVFRTS